MTQQTCLAGRDILQREVVPPEKLTGCHAVVIGVGAIGRRVKPITTTTTAPGASSPNSTSRSRLTQWRKQSWKPAVSATVSPNNCCPTDPSV
jgi:hypothetical protein